MQLWLAESSRRWIPYSSRQRYSEKAEKNEESSCNYSLTPSFTDRLKHTHTHSRSSLRFTFSTTIHTHPHTHPSPRRIGRLSRFVPSTAVLLYDFRCFFPSLTHSFFLPAFCCLSVSLFGIFHQRKKEELSCSTRSAVACAPLYLTILPCLLFISRVPLCCEFSSVPHPTAPFRFSPRPTPHPFVFHNSVDVLLMLCPPFFISLFDLRFSSPLLLIFFSLSTSSTPSRRMHRTRS